MAAIVLGVGLFVQVIWLPVCIGLSVWVKEKEPARAFLGGSAILWAFFGPLGLLMKVLGL